MPTLSLKGLIFFVSFMVLMLIENIVLRTSIKIYLQMNDSCTNNDYSWCKIFPNIDIWFIGMYIVPLILIGMTASLVLYVRLYIKDIKYLIILFPLVYIANIEIQKYIGMV